MPLRVCLLSASYPPAEIGGIGRHTELVARGLSDLGHEVHVIAQGRKRQSSLYGGAYVHRIPYNTDRYGRYSELTGLFHGLNYSHAVYERVKQLILSNGIQVVDSPLWRFEGLVTAVSDIVPVIVRLQTSLRQVARLQGRQDHDAHLIGEMEHTLIEEADYLIPNSYATLDAIKKVYDLPLKNRRHTVVPHGIVPVPDELTRPFDLKEELDTFTVLYVGRLEQRKGILDLFEAIPRVLEQIPKVEFVITGQDNSKRDGFQHRMGVDYPSYFAHRYGKWLPKVEFTGFVSDERLQDLYQTCDLFVAPSLYESFGLIYLEAMNYAKPVVGCLAGGIPEVVEHGVTGRLVEPEAPSALAEAIVSILKSPKKLYEMGMAGRQQLIENFSYRQMAHRFEDVYRKVLQDLPGSQRINAPKE